MTKTISTRKTKRFIRKRVAEPSEFKKGTFRTKKLNSKRIIIGKKKGQAKTSLQAILIPRKKKKR